MKVVELPKRGTVNESYQLIKFCAETERISEDVSLDASQIGMYGPFGIALLASMVATRRGASLDTNIVLDSASEGAAFLHEVGFERFVRGHQTGLGSLEVRQLSALDALYTDAVTKLLTEGVEGFDTDAAYPITLCLNELLQNVFEWAESAVGCFVFCRWYRQTRSVRLAVVDRGMGIPAALRRRQIQGLHRASDVDVIVAAVTTPQLTSRANKVGGLGLKTIREIVCDRGGRLTVVSLGAKVRWAGSGVSRYSSPPLRGTAIEIEFRPDATFGARKPAIELF